jgi:hypothetical protein
VSARPALLAAALAVTLVGAPGCLVLSLHPAYDDDSLAWDPALIGAWRDEEDNATMKIEAAEWRSYRVHYEHPSEKGDLTGFLTIVGDAHYLDLMPARGEDHGSFLTPLHGILRVDFADDKLTLTPLSYDWLADALRAGRSLGGLDAVFDQKQNVLIVSPTARLRSWLRKRPADNPAWGAAATFTRAQ